MTHASEVTSRSPAPAVHAHSPNGGPPGPPNARRPALVLAAAFLVGALIARWIDWRSHAHPHD
jgi:hypothetical protein